jgi:mRNA interferase MazF
VRARVRRGDIFYADLRPTVGSEQAGVRPVLVVQNDVSNRLSPTVVVCALTSQIKRPQLPTHVVVPDLDPSSPSVLLVEQMRTLDKRRLLRRIGHASPAVMRAVNEALHRSLGLTPPAAPCSGAAAAPQEPAAGVAKSRPGAFDASGG